MAEKPVASRIGDKLSDLRAIVQKKSDPSDALGSLLEEIKAHDHAKVCFSDDDIATFGSLLQWNTSCVKAKSAAVLAELAKKENFRERCGKTQIVPWLCQLILNPSKGSEHDIKALIHATRALGNLCYENARHREYITQNNGLKLLMDLIKFANSLEDVEENAELRSCSVGLLLNYLDGQEEFYPEALAAGIVDILIDVLNRGTKGQHGGNSGVHVLIVLSSLADLLSMDNKPLLNKKLCEALVKSLKESTPGELSELCIELAHSQSGYSGVSLSLANAGICQVLQDLLQQHENMSKNHELRNIFKLACDLIILILNDDESMELLYENANGQVYRTLVDWISHANDDLQITGVLAMGNFARTDTHCVDMVKQGIAELLLKLLSKHNTEAGDLKFQHALLSALRNLVIPDVNKPILLEQGLLNTLYPMISVTSFPVVFKLLATLRLAVDGQEKAACELGMRKELVTKLVSWSNTSDHLGVQGESTRLIAWIIKNSKNAAVMGVMVECNVIPCLVNMISNEHAVMQIEAFLALSILSSMRLSEAEKTFLELNIEEKLVTFMSTQKPQKEPVTNLITLVSYLCASDNLKTRLKQSSLQLLIATYAEAYSNCADLHDLSTKFAKILKMSS